MWADLPQERIHPFDTHPPLSLRIELLESSSEDGRTDDGTPASVLVEGLPDLLRRLSDLTFRGSELEPASWSQLAAEVGPRRACHLAGLLVVSSASPGLGARDLAEALRQLGRGSVRELAAALVDHNTDSSGAREAATALVAAMVESALVTHCGARHVEGWSGTWGLVDSDGQGVDAAGLVAGVIGDRHAADSLLDALVAEGVPQDFTVKPDDVSRATSAEHDLVAAAAGNAGWGRVRVLLVAADRVVVVRYGMLRLTRALLTHRHPDGYLNALHDASNRSLRDVEAMRGALAVPITEVQWVELTIRRDDVVRVHLRSRRGSVRFKTMVKTGSLGPGLAHLLGDRLRIC